MGGEQPFFPEAPREVPFPCLVPHVFPQDSAGRPPIMDVPCYGCRFAQSSSVKFARWPFRSPLATGFLEDVPSG